MNTKRIIIKIVLSIIYLVIIGILLYASYTLFKEDRKIVEWKKVEKTNQYTYLEFSEMSEAFAKIGDKQLHFVVEKEKNGVWHTYLIAIKESEYDEYKPMIDYTYKRTEVVPKPIKKYGYPSEIPNRIKKIAIKNIVNFVPIENQVVITEKNFDEYLTNTYLDVTVEREKPLNYYIVILLTIAFIIFVILIYTIIDKDKKNKIKQKLINKSIKFEQISNKDDNLEII